MRKNNSKLVQEWMEKINQQILSGKSIAAWCKEQAIPYHRFLYWHKRLQKPLPNLNIRSSFVELPEDSSQVWIEIILQGAKLMISRDFDRASLLFCLKVFGGH